MLSRELNPLNAPLPMVSTESGTIKFVINAIPSKENSPIEEHDSGTINSIELNELNLDVNEHPENAYFPMDVTSSERVIVSANEQLLNA